MRFRGEVASNDCEVARTSDFSDSNRHVLGTFTVEVNINVRRYKIPCQLSSDAKMIDLK